MTFLLVEISGALAATAAIGVLFIVIGLFYDFESNDRLTE